MFFAGHSGILPHSVPSTARRRGCHRLEVPPKVRTPKRSSNQVVFPGMSRLPPSQQPDCESGLSHNCTVTHTGTHNLTLQTEMSFIQRSPLLSSDKAKICPKTCSKEVTGLWLSLCAVGLGSSEEPTASTLQKSGCLPHGSFTISGVLKPPGPAPSAARHRVVPGAPLQPSPLLLLSPPPSCLPYFLLFCDPPGCSLCLAPTWVPVTTLEDLRFKLW